VRLIVVIVVRFTVDQLECQIMLESSLFKFKVRAKLYGYGAFTVTVTCFLLQ
jgi:hypothetical protein